MKGKVTLSSVAALKPSGDKASFLWDRELRGFGCKALPSDRKIFVVQFRHAKRLHRVVLGPLGVLTPDEARRLARAHLGSVAAGRNPAIQLA